MRMAVVSMAAILIAGCAGNDSPVAKAAGSYSGEFRIESVGGSTDAKLIQDQRIKGTLWLYATDMKSRLEMAGAHQGFTITGVWKTDGSRVTVTSDSFEFQNPTEEDQKALDLHLISPDEIRTAFGQPLVLKTSKDRRTLTGLKMTLGRLLGSFVFERPIPR